MQGLLKRELIIHMQDNHVNPFDENTIRILNEIGSRSFMPLNGQHQHSTERTCTNCIRHDTCHTANSSVNIDLLHFQLRSSWRNRSLVDYMKVVTGGICGNFEHPDSNVQASFIATEHRRIRELPAGEWD